jgi:uncharacterized protein (DUF433 family)
VKKFKRITIDPEQMAGTPCIRGLRIPVSAVVAMVAEGMKFSEIKKNYPDLKNEDIKEALKFAAEVLKEREIPILLAK